MSKCAICGKRNANKTNSHIVPSFLIAMVASADSSYKRDKEILYSITENHIKPYIGRNTNISDIERNFSELSDTELEEMRANNAAKDYIFCSQCEKALGDYLESPYATTFKENKIIKPEKSYFFWLSVLWRMNEFDSTRNKLNNFLANKLGKSLSQYIESKIKGVDIKHIFPFKYKLLYCKDYCRDNAGMIHLQYDRRFKIASGFFGDFVICFLFQGRSIPKSYSFYGLERLFRKAAINDGTLEEQRLDISVEDLTKAYSRFIEAKQLSLFEGEKEKILRLWSAARNKGMNIPISPNGAFIQQCLQLLHDDKIKVGDRCGYRYFAECFDKAYYMTYGVRLTI